MYTIFIPEGVMTVDDQFISINVATLTEEIIAQAPFAPEGFRVHLKNYYGAGNYSNIWHAIKHGFSKASPVVRDVARVVGDVSSMIPHPYAQAVGLGAKVVNKALGGRRTHHHKARSRSRSRRGGALIRSSSLADRL